MQAERSQRANHKPCVHASDRCAVIVQPDMCWVCLGESTASEPLCCPCRCPRPVHAHCLARWQLHSAGSRCLLHTRLTLHVDKHCIGAFMSGHLSGFTVM